MSVPNVRPKSGSSFFFRPLFGLPLSDSSSLGSFFSSFSSFVPLSWQHSAFCGDKKAYFAKIVRIKREETNERTNMWQGFSANK